ncbi:MAG: hypothetical protein B7X40_04275 [Cellulomonas sp. 14-74-6]|nr:MAG: hypothetical protein B7X40_04275 [Cellulomonas sp. 14-74-6]
MADEEHAPTVSEDAKAKFREALERKKSAQHRTTDGSAGSGAVRGSETSGPVQRRFQRKSGSA